MSYFQSMGSFFRERSYTLGNLIGISSFLELSRRSNRTRIDQTASRNHQQQKNLKSYKPWIFSICSKLSTNATLIAHNKILSEDDGRQNVQSLRHFLMVERRGIGSTTRSPPTIWMIMRFVIWFPHALTQQILIVSCIFVWNIFVCNFIWEFEDVFSCMMSCANYVWLPIPKIIILLQIIKHL